VIPAAGFGTRFLPASKSQPKEMLPIVDTPTIQYVVEEAVAAGITDILMIIGKGKRAIEEHFDRNFELEAELQEKGKADLLQQVRRISDLARIHFVWQKELKGLGDAVSYARDHVGAESFLLLLGDTLIESKAPLARRLIDSARALRRERGRPGNGRSRQGRGLWHRGRTPVGDGLYLIDTLVEKPTPQEAPSNLAIAARYALSPDIFEYLERTPPGKSGEIQLTDAMRLMLRDRAIYGLVFEGARFDIGNKLDFLKTNVVFGLQHPELGPPFRQFLKELREGL
jgi:UTP--glucose-1-phosphate uridylyltransferase